MISYWEEYLGGPTKPRSERVHITLNEHGVILLNRNAHRMLGSPEAAVLLFDKVNAVIGLRPAATGVANAFPVKKREYNHIIYANPFCRHYGVEVDRTMAFNEAELDDTGIMRLRLKTASTVGRPRKKPAE